MNIKEVVVLEEASEDINNGVLFYGYQEDWLGDYFFDSIVADLESLRIYAGMHSKHFGYHRMMSKRFPFALYYDLIQDIAVVVAVLDMRRKPSWIRKRLEG
ncbi:MAG: type II toxin-antitoxin system RelE/ParE family toxin [Planctomycetota bacterium]|jgi:hypothetical protein